MLHTHLALASTTAVDLVYLVYVGMYMCKVLLPGDARATRRDGCARTLRSDPCYIRGGDGEKKKNTHRHDGNHKDGIWLKKDGMKRRL